MKYSGSSFAARRAGRPVARVTPREYCTTHTSATPEGLTSTYLILMATPPGLGWYFLSLTRGVTRAIGSRHLRCQKRHEYLDAKARSLDHIQPVIMTF